MNKEYRKYLYSKEWAEIKNDLYKIRGRKCERCSARKKLQVHHKTYINIYNEQPEDLEILCDTCHKKEHRIIKTKSGKFKKQLSLAEKVRLKNQKRQQRTMQRIGKQKH